MFNSNAIHNLLNVAIAVLAAMAAFDWQIVFSPGTAATIIGGLATLKVVINALRDGVAGMIKPQPPVQS